MEDLKVAVVQLHGCHLPLQSKEEEENVFHQRRRLGERRGRRSSRIVWIITHFNQIRVNKAQCLLFARQSAVATDL